MTGSQIQFSGESVQVRSGRFAGHAWPTPKLDARRVLVWIDLKR